MSMLWGKGGRFERERDTRRKENILEGGVIRFSTNGCTNQVSTVNIICTVENSNDQDDLSVIIHGHLGNRITKY